METRSSGLSHGTATEDHSTSLGVLVGGMAGMVPTSLRATRPQISMRPVATVIGEIIHRKLTRIGGGT